CLRPAPVAIHDDGDVVRNLAASFQRRLFFGVFCRLGLSGEGDLRYRFCCHLVEMHGSEKRTYAVLPRTSIELSMSHTPEKASVCACRINEANASLQPQDVVEDEEDHQREEQHH